MKLAWNGYIVTVHILYYDKIEVFFALGDAVDTIEWFMSGKKPR